MGHNYNGAHLLKYLWIQFGVIFVDELRFSTAGVNFPDGVTAPAAPVVVPQPTPPTSSETPPKASTEPYKWIMGPTIDMLFVCGGFFWIMVAALYLTNFEVNLYGSPTAFSLATISIIGLQLMGDAHQPATLFRVYGSKTTRDTLGKPSFLDWHFRACGRLVRIFCLQHHNAVAQNHSCLGIQHQLAQSYGIGLVYCYKRKYYLNKNEKQIMFLMVQSAIVFMIVRMFSAKEFAEFRLSNSIDVPFWNVLPAWTTTARRLCPGCFCSAFRRRCRTQVHAR